MKASTLIIIIIFFNLFSRVNADEVTGVQKYDWQSCLDSKTNDCMTRTCVTSSDPHCKDTCVDTAKAKCLSEGISPPY